MHNSSDYMGCLALFFIPKILQLLSNSQLPTVITVSRATTSTACGAITQEGNIPIRLAEEQ